ncbi:DUF255 domain-containing protein [Sulfurimonas sp. SWIR-19]|uniref:thioredoxin family protein n=1 Tax=Sulfurimonas sp. SWIR-19 TaxID=2878390 RepID=UPI001CF11EC1|nr:DUF255 domain-containing protein [Sulfurimonas sp. SWIR-19]UCM99723.1 DUF255 domain-containing protein [Sulfurimonas sp. SWIR-19]
MGKLLLVLAFVLTTSLMADEIHWAKNYQEGMAQAQKEHKPVLFIISSHSCKYCLLLDKTTLKDEKVVQKINKNFIAVRSWTDKRDYIPAVLAQNTPGLPGIWFLLPNGDPMFQPLLGYAKKDVFLQALEIVQKEFNTNQKRVKK